MDINKDDIIDLIERYRFDTNFSFRKMAKLCGMSSGSVYLYNCVERKVESFDFNYVMSFLVNTNTEASSFFRTIENKKIGYLPNDNDEIKKSEDAKPPYNIRCTNPECIEIIAELEKKIARYEKIIDDYQLGKENTSQKHAKGGLERRNREAG